MRTSGKPREFESKYINTRLSPLWAESPTPSNKTYTRKDLATDLYGNPLPPVASQRHRSTVAPSSLDPRNYSQTKTAFYAKIIKDASNGESSRNDDSSEHDSSSVEDVPTSVEDVTTSSSCSSEDGSECKSSKEVVDSDVDRSTSESDSSQKKEVSSDSDESADTKVSTVERNQDPPVIVEDANSSDDESEDTNSEQSETETKEENIPLENYILCDPPAKPFVTATSKSVESSSGSCESMNLLYTLIGSDKIYPDNDFQ
ncbi:dentin sialophosphoprotein-like [Helianthus annuus]|uniref:dentin sialophosphoprotein-like n=1 Tax=Helianthus annuus TaxID=4232 RepID=UPI000B8F3332|nr:dentin sialophosphoprotein-like [Helianthus annuus]